MPAAAFDEVWGNSVGEQPREGFEALARWIHETPAAELDRRQSAAEAAFRQLGITFAVYGESEAAERIIPFDIVPRMFSAQEWRDLKSGLEQRVFAINAFLADVYGERKILRDGVVPADLILGNHAAPPAGGGLHAAARRLRAYLRHRHGAHRPRATSSCWRTMPARPRASPTCWRIARR